MSISGENPPKGVPIFLTRLHAQQQMELIDRALSEAAVDDPGERLDDTDVH
ncbi:MAG: hypothetical protein ABW080_02855 [Candidatus Thiodiazotropha sp.]